MNRYFSWFGLPGTVVLTALILHEQFTPKSIVGCALIAAGTLLIVL